MKKIFYKFVLYCFFIAICLEVWIRIFHLAKDTPTRYLDENKVEKWMPNQNGYAVTGNRRQNFAEYHINASGYNSYREFNPSQEGFELALVGDSFIEGFHQNYYQSIGKKIENKIPGVEVYEYGYAGYDMADQLHLIHQYKNQFKLIDIVILGLKYDNDLNRDVYKVEGSRLALESPMNKIFKKSKLLVYLQSIGVFTPAMDFVKIIKQNILLVDNTIDVAKKTDEALFVKRVENLESLVRLYGFDKKKFYFLIDESLTPYKFLLYLNKNDYQYIEIGKALKNSTKRTTLIYDDHWNNIGREIVASQILESIKIINP
jgi:hypothetical protein